MQNINQQSNPANRRDDLYAPEVLLACGRAQEALAALESAVGDGDHGLRALRRKLLRARCLLACGRPLNESDLSGDDERQQPALATVRAQSALVQSPANAAEARAQVDGLSAQLQSAARSTQLSMDDKERWVSSRTDDGGWWWSVHQSAIIIVPVIKIVRPRARHCEFT